MRLEPQSLNSYPPPPPPRQNNLTHPGRLPEHPEEARLVDPLEDDLYSKVDESQLLLTVVITLRENGITGFSPTGGIISRVKAFDLLTKLQGPAGM